MCNTFRYTVWLATADKEASARRMYNTFRYTVCLATVDRKASARCMGNTIRYTAIWLAPPMEEASPQRIASTPTQAASCPEAD